MARRLRETPADLLYLEQMGAEAYARQMAERERHLACNCPMKGKSGQYHAPDCPVSGLAISKSLRRR